MNDDQVLEYLRGRGRAEPPMEFVGSVMNALAEVPQPRRSWFAPAALGAAALVAVLVVVLIASPPPSTGPPNLPSRSALPSTPATPGEEPVPSELPTIDADLTVPGNRFAGDAFDIDRTWGTISLLRGEDVGGYRAVSVLDLDLEDPDPASMYFRNDPDAFYLEIFVRYEPAGAYMPANYGRSEWNVLLPGGEALEPIRVGIGGPLELHDSTADVALVNPDLDIKGWLIFEIPRTAAESELSLDYKPVASGAPAWSVLVRTPGPAPDHIPTVQPPRVATYRAQPGAPITVADNAPADALFVEPDTCTNPEAGYTVAFPESWYTNTAIGEVPACSWFSPVFYEVADPADVPDEVVIVVRHSEASGIGGLGQGIYGDTSEIDGVPAGRAEQVGVGGGFLDMGSFHYGYTLNRSGSAPAGDDQATFIAAATTWLIDEDVADYELNRAVLDRIIASLEFTD